MESNSPWARYALLSLDGGGIRGFASMLLLEALMDHVKELEQSPAFLKSLQHLDPNVNTANAESSFHPHGCPIQDSDANLFLPCHYFDCIIGTSTGGLIAIMLGRLRMTVTHARKQYERLGDEIFGSPRWVHYNGYINFPRSKFDCRNLEKAVRRVVRDFDSSPPDHPHGFPNPAFCKTDYDLCKTIVTAYGRVCDPDTRAVLKDGTFFFQTYDYIPALDNPGFAFAGPIWDVARASTAALTYFDPCEIPAFNGNIWRFQDAGMLRVNNPTEEGVTEVKRWGPNHDTHAFDAVVSIGTGSSEDRDALPRRAGGLADVIGTLTGIFTHSSNTEKVHQAMEHEFPPAPRRKYWRFNHRHDDWAHIFLDEWNGVKGSDTMEKMSGLITDYLKSDGVQQQLKTCAETLVKRRRLRHAADEDKWERFSQATMYKCDHDGCFRNFHNREDLSGHFLARKEPALDSRLDACRRLTWTYRY